MAARQSPSCDSSQPAGYGGQAVIEGVMMRNRERMAIAVRRPDGGIEVRSEPMGAAYRARWATWPFVRGLFILYDSLVIGMKALMYSADVASGDDVDMSGPVMWGTMALSMALGLGLFFALPALASKVVEGWLHSDWLTNTVEGLIRLALFLGYLVAIARMEDIQRVFAYHGAEHKVINAYESGESLDLETVRAYSTRHNRCGTAFLLIVVVVSVIVFGFLGRPPMLMLLLSRLVLIPFIAAVSYELVRLSSRYREHPLARIVFEPSLRLQALTTRNPSDDMIEVALTAMRRVLAGDSEPEPVRAGEVAVA